MGKSNKINTVCLTILQQINFRQMAVMIGAYDCFYDNKTNTIGFFFRMCKKFNSFRIQYMAGSDLYKISFTKIVHGEIIDQEITDDVYADQLLPIFEQTTGLRTSLKRVYT